MCAGGGGAQKKKRRDQLPSLLLTMASKQNFGRGIKPGHHVALPLMVISGDFSAQPWFPHSWNGSAKQYVVEQVKEKK